MIFVDAVPPGLVYTGAERERTRYNMGPAGAYASLCRVTAIRPKDNNTVTISCVVEDNRVHTADADYFDNGGGTGGNVRPAKFAPDGTPVYGSASQADHDAYSFYADDTAHVGGTDGSYRYS